MVTVEECLNLPYVNTSIEVIARKLSGALPATMNFEDARQELIIGLLERLPRFNPAKGSIKTFAHMVLSGMAWNMVHTKRLYACEQHLPIIEAAITESASRSMELRVIDSMTCDLVESKLEGRTREIFCRLRQGESQINIARIMHVNRNYINRLLKENIWKVVNKCTAI